MTDFYIKLDELYSTGDLSAVESYLREAIDAASPRSPEQAALYNELAGFYRGVSRFRESENAFSRALEIFDVCGMGATPQYATVLLNLAGLLRMRGEASEAIGLFKDALGKLEESGEQESYAYVSLLNNISLAHKEKGEFGIAFEYANRALTMMRSGLGGDHEIAASLNNLAAIKLSQCDYPAADGFVTEALMVFNAMPEPDVHHAAALTTKSVLLFHAEDFQGALDGFRTALSLTRRFFGENIEYAICKRNISDVHVMLGDIPSAIEELSEAARVFEKIYGAQHETVIQVRSKLDKLLDAN